MRILHIETGRHLYGGARQVLYLMEGLARAGAAGVLVCPPRSAVEIAARARGLDVINVPIRGDMDPAFALRIAGLVRRIRPSVVHVHSRGGADSLGGPAARLVGAPTVLTRRVDTSDPLALGKLKYAAYRRVIGVSRCVMRQLKRQGVAESKLRLVYSAVDPSDCRPAWSRDKFLSEFDLKPDDHTIGVVGELIPRKGHKYLLEALPRLRASVPGLRLLVFGDGPLQPRIAEQAAALDLESLVHFAGYRTDLLDFLGHLHLVMHAATREGLGMGILEAQAAGVPVVGFRAGGVPEAVAEGSTGLLVSPGDSDALANAAMQILWNPKRRRAMSTAARDWVVQEFGLERMVRGNLQVYDELLADRARAA